MYGNRTVCGIGRGDSAMRVAGRPPTTLARLGEAMRTIRELAEGRETVVDGTALRLPWVGGGRPTPGVDGRLRAQGAGPGRTGGGRVHPPARRPAADRLDGACGTGGGGGRRPRSGGGQRLRGRARLRVRGHHGSTRARPRAVPMVRRHGRQPRRRPRRPLRRALRRRTGGTHLLHQGAGRLRLHAPRSGRQPRHRVRARRDRRPVLSAGARLRAAGAAAAELAELGVDQFALYAMHDAKEATVDAYGASVVPELS